MAAFSRYALVLIAGVAIGYVVRYMQEIINTITRFH